jgi:hypothetical protein
MLLFGEELTSLALSDEFFSIGQSCGLVEISSKSFAHQHATRRVIAVETFVDSSKMSLPSFQCMHSMSTLEVAPRL